MTSRSPLPIHLYTPFYKDPDPTRASELATCLKKNIEHPDFDKIVVFVDSLETYAPLRDESPKVELVQTPERMPHYNDFLNHARKETDPFILVMINTDIYFDETLSRVREIAGYPEELWCLTRREGPKETNPPFCEHVQSSDTWIMNGPVDITIPPIQLGKLHCESYFLRSVARENYKIRNVSADIHTYHLHSSQKRNYDPEVDKFEDTDHYCYPLFGTLPSTKEAAKDNRENILFDSAVFYQPHLGAMRVWLNFATAWAQLISHHKTVLMNEHPSMNAFQGLQQTTGAIFNSEFSATHASIIDAHCAKAKAKLFLSGAYQRAANIPTINFIYDMPEIELDGQLELSSHKYLALAEAEGLVFFNSAVQEAAYEIFPKAKKKPATVIPLPQCTTMTRQSPNDVENIRHQLELNHPYIVFSGERMGFGGYGNALGLLQGLRDVPEPYDVVFTGGAADLEPVLESSGFPGKRVRLTHPEDHIIAALLSGAVAHICPQFAPGLGTSILDAFACECPVIARQSAASSETTSESTIVITQCTASQLQTALDIAKDPEKRITLTTAGKKRLAEHSWGKVIAAVEGVVNEVLATHYQ